MEWFPLNTLIAKLTNDVCHAQQLSRCHNADHRGGPGLEERLQELGRQPHPDHRVYHRLPHPQPGVPRHHHLWSGGIILSYPRFILLAFSMLKPREWLPIPWTRF